MTTVLMIGALCVGGITVVFAATAIALVIGSGGRRTGVSLLAVMGLATVCATSAVYLLTQWQAQVVQTHRSAAASALESAYAAEQTLHAETGSYSTDMADLAAVSPTVMAYLASSDVSGAQQGPDDGHWKMPRAVSAGGTRLALVRMGKLPAVEIEVWSDASSSTPTVERALAVSISGSIR